MWEREHTRGKHRTLTTAVPIFWTAAHAVCVAPTSPPFSRSGNIRTKRSRKYSCQPGKIQGLENTMPSLAGKYHARGECDKTRERALASTMPPLREISMPAPIFRSGNIRAKASGKIPCHPSGRKSCQNPGRKSCHLGRERIMP